jgi:predicted MPP superfamily phosphohydrolase
LYTWRIEPHWIEVVRRPLPISGLPQHLAGKRLVQISYIHAGPIVDQDYLIGAMERVQTLQPDLIVLTGDFMTCYADEQTAKALDVIGALPLAPLGRRLRTLVEARGSRRQTGRRLGTITCAPTAQ